MLALTSWTQVSHGAPESLPRGLGPFVQLGASEASFEKQFNVVPIRCASCYQGEKLAELSAADIPSISAALKGLGFQVSHGSYDVNIFFYNGVIDAIYVERLESSIALDSFFTKFGRGRVLQDTAELLEVEWRDASTQFRLTRWHSEFQLILSNRIKSRTPRSVR